jgi:hypothetical protein
MTYRHRMQGKSQSSTTSILAELKFSPANTTNKKVFERIENLYFFPK